MYTAGELPQFQGWGHSSMEQGQAFLEMSNCRRLAVAHHAPHRTDAQLDKIQQGFANPAIFIAKENQTEILTGV